MHWWFSGRILACHAGGPGSIPGQCTIILIFFFFTFSSIKLAAQPVHDNLIFFSLHSQVLSWQIFLIIYFNKALFFDLSICQFVLLSFWRLWYNRIMMVFNTCILRLSWNWSHDLFINILLNGVLLRDGDKMLPKILIINLNVHNMYMNYQHTI